MRVQIAADITDRAIDEVNLQQKRLEQTSRLITMGVKWPRRWRTSWNQPLSAIVHCAGCIKRMQAGNYKFEDLLSAMQKASDRRARRQDHPPHARHGEEK